MGNSNSVGAPELLALANTSWEEEGSKSKTWFFSDVKAKKDTEGEFTATVAYVFRQHGWTEDR